ncbi:MAG: hypothetical protein J7L47_03920, partial [Candidatus Odinarchaeota archaeon]|nr:hypothetical protein [Candidatus Odinarchaeota archaeon]
VIIRNITIYANTYFINVTDFIFNPTSTAATLYAGWSSGLTRGPFGYMIGWAGILGATPSEWQSWAIGDEIYIEQDPQNWLFGRPQREGYDITPPDIKWVALIDVEENAIGGISVQKGNPVEVYCESGGWGRSVRLEFPSFTLQPNEGEEFSFFVYGGPIDDENLTSSGFTGLSDKLPPFTVSMDLDRFSYLPNGQATATIKLTNIKTDSRDAELDVTITYKNGTVLSNVDSRTITVSGKSTITQPIDFTVPNTEGVFNIIALVKDKASGTTTQKTLPLVIVQPSDTPLVVSFVWHLHQPIYINPDGYYCQYELFDKPWAQYHIYKGTMPYMQHVWAVTTTSDGYKRPANIPEGYPEMNVTINLVPSLLYQWNVTTDGWALWNGTHYVKNPENGLAVNWAKWAIGNYSNLAKEGNVEILTTPFYHPILPLLILKGWAEDAKAQVIGGKQYTYDLLGVNASGMWAPEQAFSLDVVPIIADVGITHLALDPSVLWAVNSSATIFKPWIIKDPNTNKSVVVFFRDEDISNAISFGWNNYVDTKLAAREYIAKLADIYLMDKNDKRVVAIALDGENWMGVIGGAANSPMLLWDFYNATIEEPWLVAATLEQAMEMVPPAGTLTDIGTGSWADGLSIWIGEPEENKIWDYLADKRKFVAAYNYSVPDYEDIKNKAWNFIHIAEGSDWFWWAGFDQNTVDDEWYIGQAYKYADVAALLVNGTLEEISSSISVAIEKGSSTGVFPPLSQELAVDTTNLITITVKNSWNGSLNLVVYVTAPYGEFPEGQEFPITVDMNSMYTLVVPFIPNRTGTLSISVTVRAEGYTFTTESALMTVSSNFMASSTGEYIIYFGGIAGVAIVVVVVFFFIKKKK